MSTQTKTPNTNSPQALDRTGYGASRVHYDGSTKILRSEAGRPRPRRDR